MVTNPSTLRAGPGPVARLEHPNRQGGHENEAHTHNAHTDKNARASIESATSLHEQIRRRAYELYEKRGREDGHDVEAWLEAESEMNEENVKALAAQNALRGPLGTRDGRPISSTSRESTHLAGTVSDVQRQHRRGPRGNALHALHALRSCLELRTRKAAAA